MGERVAAEWPVRRVVGWCLIGSLCLAALVASIALLTGDFSDTEGRVLGTTLGFAFFSATGASGASLRQADAGGRGRGLGGVTSAFSAAAFALLAVAIWAWDNHDWIWEAWGAVGIAVLVLSHASIVVRALRRSDTRAVRTAAVLSIAFAVIDGSVGVLAIAGAIHSVDDAGTRVLSVLAVLLLLTTALQPLLRRFGTARAPERARSARRLSQPEANLATLVDEVTSVAERLERMAGSPELATEARRLRDAAREASSG